MVGLLVFFYYQSGIAEKMNKPTAPFAEQELNLPNPISKKMMTIKEVFNNLIECSGLII